jgi:autotransporter-associated beta strand protein
VAGSNHNSTTFSGTVSGAGAFTKAGAGTLTLSGSMLQTSDTYITDGTLAVAGGSLTAPANELVIANTGTGALLVSGGAVTAHSVIIGHDGGTATVTLDGGTLTTTEVARWSVPSTIAFNGGTLRAAGDTSVLLNGFTNGSAVLQAGGLTVDTNGFTVSTAAELTGSGTLTKAGTGTLSLTGAFAHTGATVVNAGTLRVTSARLSDTGRVTVASGASLHLDFPGTDTVNALTLAGIPYIAGTWGAPGSGAEHESPLLSGTGRLTVVNELTTWLTASGFPGGTAGGDDDHDGLTNLDEYYHGTHPGQSSSTTTTASHAPGVIEITFDRRKGLQAVTAVVEWSADLASWSTDGVSAPQIIADQGTTERLRVTVPRPEAAPRRYVRVRPLLN